MLFLIFCIAASHGVMANSENIVLDFKMGSTLTDMNNKEAEHNIIVYENTPVQIRIYSDIIHTVRCHSGINEKFINVDKIWKYKNTFNFNVTAMKSDDVWVCLFTMENGRFNTLNFNVHLRKILPPLLMFVDQQHVQASSTPLAVTEYDSVAYYYFNAGETAIINCQSRNKIATAVIVENGSFIPFFKMAGKTPGDNSLFLKLTEDYDDKFIDCIDFKYETYVTRLIFKLKSPKDPKSIIKLAINGMRVHVNPSNNSNYYYSYCEFEKIHIKIGVHNTDHSSLLVIYDHIEHFSTNNYVTTLFLSIADHRKEMLILATHTKFATENLTLYFTYRSKDIFVTDLDKSNILKEYDEYNRSVVYLQYSDNDSFSIAWRRNLLLHCDLSHNYTSYREGDFSYLKLRVTLRPELNNVEIICSVAYRNQIMNENLRKVSIILIYKPPGNIDNVLLPGRSRNPWIKWIISILVILAIIIILGLVIIIRKKWQSSVSITRSLPSCSAPELPKAKPVEEQKQATPPAPSNHQQNHHQGVEASETDIYNEVYYEPSFPRSSLTYAENDYAYVDCPHLGERQRSVFDSVTSRMALDKARRGTKNDYHNLREFCRPGHCVMRPNGHD